MLLRKNTVLLVLKILKNTILESNSVQLKSILTDINTKQYDIIYVDWNNGVDYIQKNAYVLQEVIKWVNEQKIISGSITPNVVWGQSMGGLIARYALKNMEDSGIPHQTNLYISHDAPQQGANIPMGYQYFSRHALHQYVQAPLAFLGGEIILPLFTDGVTPLDYLMLQNTPAARQMLINYIDVDYSINNTKHNSWQTELKTKGYPSIRKIAISNGNHCAIPQNATAGSQLLSFDGNYSTGWLTDMVLTIFPGVNETIFKTLAVFTNEPEFLIGILPGGNKLKLDFKVNSLPNSSINQLYKGKITYTKKLLWVLPINVTITDKSINSPSNTLPFDYYPGGAFDTGIRNSSSATGTNFWQQALVKYKMSIATEPTFSFVPSTSALDISKGNIILIDGDYLMKYNSQTPPVTPKDSPFQNFTTSFQNSFVVAQDNYSSTNEHHIYLNNKNADWLAKEIDNMPNNNQIFNCSYFCSGNTPISITGNTSINNSISGCGSSIYSIPNVVDIYRWTVTENSNYVTLTGDTTNTATLTAVSGFSGNSTLSLTYGSEICGYATITKRIWIGQPTFNVQKVIDSCGAYRFTTLTITNTDTSHTYDYSFFDLPTGVTYSSTSYNTFLFKIANTYTQNYFTYGVKAILGCSSSSYHNYTTLGSCPTTTSTLRTATTTDTTTIYDVYPNPTSDILNISLIDESNAPVTTSKITATLYDLNGKEKQSATVNNNIASLNVNHLKKGIYVLKINIDGQIETHQVIIE
ncbi:T9SS type A sorting domain-containing protein [Flavobacterium restrictum]|uniref:T9SS type A sorting domain-containing protein n=1 Tax=Flavobacterium restrictum TaxID=2594428 RepID=A0A553E359_9FLAO|nr:T9SS type A sorting domain-containing protein [Flavobacterium restrictum]TRX39400.1 T9SS type A sorting domain-containing protein [Flavobacterium restrictum]